MMRIWFDIGPHAPDQDGPAVDGILGVQLSPPVLERADEARREHTGLAVDERLTPLMCRRVVLSSMELVEPDKGSKTRLMWVFHVPKLKSKSC